MKPEAIEALRKSIKHWEQLRYGESKDTIGPRSCALCQMFWKMNERIGQKFKVRCSGCPVAARTGKPGCIDTPYDLLAESRWSEHYDSEFDWHQSSEFKSIAEMELKFLVSLLPFDEWRYWQPPSASQADYDKLQSQPMKDFNE